MPARIPDEQIIPHFWSKVNKDGPVPEHRPELGACWIWTAGTNGRYPVFTIHRKRTYAHRFAYEVTYGALKDGKLACHRCDNGPGGCVRPDHIYPGTYSDNARDALDRGKLTKETCRHGHTYAETGVIVAGENTKKPGKRSCYACVMKHRQQVSARSAPCQGVLQTNDHGRLAGQTCQRKVPAGQRFCAAHRAQQFTEFVVKERRRDREKKACSKCGAECFLKALGLCKRCYDMHRYYIRKADKERNDRLAAARRRVALEV